VRSNDFPLQCQSCGGVCKPLLSVTDVNRRISDDVFDYFRCAACGVVVLKNRPLDISRYYGGGYVAVPRSPAELERIAGRTRPKLEILLRFARAGRLLEIGPGMGAFAWLAKRAGFDVSVMEQDVNACRFLETTVGVKVIRTSTPEQALLDSGGRYDVIALWHAIEHLPHAWETLARAVAALNDNGVLVVATPNPSAWQFGWLGARWPHIDAPRHLWLIPMDAMRRYVEPMGVQLIWWTTNDPEGRSWNVFGWSQTLRNLTPTAIRNSLLVRLVSRVAGSLFAQVVLPWESAEFNGSAYTAVFRKVTKGETTS
jgi:Methyltransferase domain